MFRRKRKQRDFAAEIEAHLGLEMDRFREQGLSEDEARMAARRSFGSVMMAEERFYEAGRWLWWDHLRQDLRYSVRLMAKSPALTAIIILTLALGIGANSVIFSAVRAVVLRPLEYKDPDRLVQLWDSGSRSGGEADWASFPDFKDWRRENRVFEEMAAYRFTLVTLTGGQQPESAVGLEVTDRLFAVLGVQPAVGRTFLPGEDTPGREAVAVISHALWVRRFGGDPAVSGKHLNVDGRPYTIAGVMPPSFHFPRAIPSDTMVVSIDIWIPIRPSPDLEERGSHNFWAIGRLKTGVTLTQARADMDSIAANLAREYPGSNKDMGVAVVRLQDHLTEGVRPALLVLLAAVGLVLLLACANIANLLLSRAESRRREMAIREALGAGRGRLIIQTLTESLLLATLGATAGLVIAHFGTRLLLKLGPANIPRFQETTIDMQVLLFTATITIGAGLLFGLAPALLATPSNAYSSLKEAGARSTHGRRNLVARNFLVAGEIALAVMLLIGAGLLIRSFVHLALIDPGFRPAHVLSGYINLPESRYHDPKKQIAFFEEALRRIRTLPGVQSAAVANSVPLTGLNDQGDFGIEGRPGPPPGQDGPQANRPRVSSDYFHTLDIRLVKGRFLDQHDRSDSPYVAVISDLAANTYWPRENPIGRRIAIGFENGKPLWRQIVGVVQNTRHFGLEAPQKAEIYLPHTQTPSPFMILVVRAAGDPSSLIPLIRREIGAIDPEQAGFGFESMDDLLANAQSRRRFQTVLLAAFAGLALLLAAIGIYGVTAYTVAQRTREIGVRLALGALPRDVISMVMKKSLLLTVIGMAAGLGTAAGLTRVLARLLFGVSPLDLATYAAVAALLAVIAALSTYLPGRAAARVDPLIALHEE